MFTYNVTVFPLTEDVVSGPDEKQDEASNCTFPERFKPAFPYWLIVGIEGEAWERVVERVVPSSILPVQGLARDGTRTPLNMPWSGGTPLAEYV